MLSSIGKSGKVNASRRTERRAALELAHYAKFRELIESVNGHFDLVLFDTPGNPGLLTNLALSASDWALAVMRPSGFDVNQAAGRCTPGAPAHPRAMGSLPR